MKRMIIRTKGKIIYIFKCILTTLLVFITCVCFFFFLDFERSMRDVYIDFTVICIFFIIFTRIHFEDIGRV